MLNIILKPKSNKQILKSIENLSNLEEFKKGCKYGIL